MGMAGRARRRPGPLPIAVVLGIVASGVLVWRASTVAFSGQASTGNHVAAGTVVISDDRAGRSVLAVSGLTPGRSTAGCTVVRYGGTVPAVVRLYAGAYTDDRGLGAVATIAVQAADGGQPGDGCASFPAGAATVLPAQPVDAFATHTGYATGVPAEGGWRPTGPGQSRTYRITAALPARAGNALQGARLQITLVWEARSV
jgi:hypothetical protein